MHGRGLVGARRMFALVAAAAVLLATSASLTAQTPFTFTGNTNNLWSVPTNWNPSTSPPAPPNDPSAAVAIPAGKMPQANGSFTIGSLSTAPTAFVNITGSTLAIQSD